ncbi:MAG: hypothetical protein WD275_00590 [Rhodothermales bacterium]
MTEYEESTEVFTGLPDTARVWIYAADRDLNANEQERLTSILADFCAVWSSHGRKVESSSAVLAGRFVILAGLIPGGDVSGCGVDASVHALDRATAELGLSWLPSIWVHFRDASGAVHSCTRSQFRELARSGEVGAETPVFDLNLQTLGELRRGAFESAARNSWHGRVFALGSRPNSAMT